MKLSRLFLAGLVAVPLATFSGAHALSSASLRNAPELSRAVFPPNAVASERLAYAAFLDGVKGAVGAARQDKAASSAAQADGMPASAPSPADLQRLARSPAQAAREALKREPLLPKAHALLALSEADPQKRRRIVTLASNLNRREISLQALVLQQRAEANDYAATIDTLDQILRVHPERQAEFFSLLVNALTQRETRTAFSNLVRDPLPWRDAFLGFAVGKPEALENLAAIRQDIDLDNRAFDQRLIAGLVAQGRIDEAASLYNLVAGSEQGTPAGSWQADYPPFDWQLADTPGLRAQSNSDGTRLEFSVDPGEGGILASRIIPAPSSAFEIRVPHELDPSSEREDLKLRVSCVGQITPFFEDTFANRKSVFAIRRRPDCQYLEVAIAGRAWTGSRALSGTFGELQVISR
ncbi:hypothetical protein J3454_15755 [Erythrobacter sp. NFXS35]|uniref:hypothetical protein n=1 Tax=Erythrobacter sp. NFXS35 TaxID=2818436 RepID=UPI0032DFD95A